MPVQHGPCNQLNGVVYQVDTKLTGDIAVQHAILEGLKRGWGVLIPVGDRLPYDLVYDVVGRLVRVQVKCAYSASGGFAANVRRAKTNRAVYKHERYNRDDFDIALLWHPVDLVFYVMPIEVFLTFKSTVRLPSAAKAINRHNRSDLYRDAWGNV